MINLIFSGIGFCEPYIDNDAESYDNAGDGYPEYGDGTCLLGSGNGNNNCDTERAYYRRYRRKLTGNGYSEERGCD